MEMRYDSLDTEDVDRVKLKREIRTMMMEIALVDADKDGDYEMIDKAILALGTLRDLKSNKHTKKRPSLASKLDALKAPDEIRCPITRELMIDPVVIASHKTYERLAIEKCLRNTHKLLPLFELTPNTILKEVIEKWRKEHGITTEKDRSLLISLMDKLSSDDDGKQAAKEIRSMTKNEKSCRSFFSESSDYIQRLLGPLISTQRRFNTDEDLQEDVVTALHNISLEEGNKKMVAEYPVVIPLLVRSLTSGSEDTKSNAAATLCSLSELESNRQLIGESDAMKPLIGMIKDGKPSCMKDAALAISELCILTENTKRAVADGAVGVVLDKIKEGVVDDQLLSVLALLAGDPEAMDEFGELGGAGCMLGLMRESTTSELDKEKCVDILGSICVHDRELEEVSLEEKEKGTISKLAKTGTPKAQEKANGLLDKLKMWRGKSPTLAQLLA